MAVEADRVVPPSGNLQVGGQQVWLGPALADRKVTIWVDETSLHVLLDGARIKTLPSRLGVAELARLASAGARPAGPSPLLAGTGTAVEIERTVNAAGLVGLAGAQVNVGYQLAGQRVTLRMDGTQMMVITSDGELARTMPCPVPAGDRYRLRGARKAAPAPLPPSGPVTVQRRVSSRGGIMVATQKIQVGLIHAGKIVTVTAGDHAFRLIIDGQAVGVVPRTTTSEIHRYKAYAAHPRREGGDMACPMSGSMSWTRPSSPSCCNSSASGWPAIGAASAPPWKSSSATPPTTSASCARTWTGSPSCSAATTASPCSATARPSEVMTMASPLRGPKSTEGGGFAAAHFPARRAGYGAAPPASKGAAHRAARDSPAGCPWTPETTAAPGARKSGQAQACPRAARGAQTRAVAGAHTSKPDARKQMNWRSIVTRNGKITNLGWCQGSSEADPSRIK